ncbi:MAG: hypothetical protein AB7P49_02050 [Bdellovibrionales bacterium]
MNTPVTVYPGTMFSYLAAAIHVFLGMEGIVKSSNCAILDPVHILSIVMHFILLPFDGSQPLVAQIIFNGCVVLFYRALMYHQNKKSISAVVLAVQFVIGVSGAVWSSSMEPQFDLWVYPTSVVVSVLMAMHVFSSMQAIEKCSNCATLDPAYILAIGMHIVLPPVDYTQPIVAQLYSQAFILFFYRYLLYNKNKRAFSANILILKFVVELGWFVATTVA